MTSLDYVIAVTVTPLFNPECCCSQDCVRSRWAQTRALPDHAHHQGEERPRKPQTAAYDGDRYKTLNTPEPLNSHSAVCFR